MRLQNMVSSLPFLAPVFLRKAKEYRSKQSSSDNKSGRLGASKERYKLSKIGQGEGVFASASGQSTSEENILKDSLEHSIMKSVTYSVRVDDQSVEGKRSRDSSP